MRLSAFGDNMETIAPWRRIIWAKSRKVTMTRTYACPLREQSRPQSPRYPCPAERENEDLWEDAFELGISLAIDRACTVPPEVDKQ